MIALLLFLALRASTGADVTPNVPSLPLTGSNLEAPYASAAPATTPQTDSAAPVSAPTGGDAMASAPAPSSCHLNIHFALILTIALAIALSLVLVDSSSLALPVLFPRHLVESGTNLRQQRLHRHPEWAPTTPTTCLLRRRGIALQ
ncbi:hypothetical protein CVIRNUC_004517 [Coccomyxa viridis]|nr:hypothetical protein CVIRNUC_004517 [Coccomyxa viridis]